MSERTQVFHHRDPSLDDPYGEGTEWTLYRCADGRWYQEKTFVHIDADGPRVTEGYLSSDDALAGLARWRAGEAMREHFPDSWQARAFARFRTCDTAAIAEAAGAALAADAEVVAPSDDPEADLDGGDLGVTEVGLWTLAATEAQGPRVLEPEDALDVLLRRGAGVEVLERFFPASDALAILRRVGAASWAELAHQRVDELLATATLMTQRVYRNECRGDGLSLHLYQLDGGEFVSRLWRVGVEQPELQSLSRADAYLTFVGSPEATEEAMARFFPEPEARAEALGATGLVFPEG